MGLSKYVFQSNLPLDPSDRGRLCTFLISHWKPSRHSSSAPASSLLAVIFMDGVSAVAATVGLVEAAAQVTTAPSHYISSVKSVQPARTQLLDQIRLISVAGTAIESVVQDAPHSSRTPELQALIDEWSKADGAPARCKRELEALTIWLEAQVERRMRNRWAKSLVWPVKEDKIRTTVRTLERCIPYFRDILSIDTLYVGA